MTDTQSLSESLGDYLKVIFDLESTQKVARAKDIANRMKVRRGSVTNALKSLEEKGLINYAPYSFITLTQSGQEIAKQISQRHNVLKTFLHKMLNVSEKSAETTAGRMEHAIDEETLERFLVFFDFIGRCPRAGEDWIQAFSGFCSSGNPETTDCVQCLERCMATIHKRDLAK